LDWIFSPPVTTYYDPGYGTSAYFLFVKSGGDLTIYKGDANGVTEDPANQVFFGDYLNPDGNFIFMLGTGNPNSGWIKVRDVTIQTENIVACDGTTPIPMGWNIMSTKKNDIFCFPIKAKNGKTVMICQ
jgi:hypothetical protein